MADLPPVASGDPHVIAHNAERSAINELKKTALPANWVVDDHTLASHDMTSGVGHGVHIGAGNETVDPMVYIVWNPGGMDSEGNQIGANGVIGITPFGLTSSFTKDDGETSTYIVTSDSINLSKNPGPQVEGQPPVSDQTMISINPGSISFITGDNSFNASIPEGQHYGELAIEKSRLDAVPLWALTNESGPANTDDKYAGKTLMLIDSGTSTYKPVFAVGSGRNDPWVFHDGTVATTPTIPET